jgi:hypothetical protein
MASIEGSCPFLHKDSQFAIAECLHLFCVVRRRFLPAPQPLAPCVHPITGTLPTLKEIEVKLIYMRKISKMSGCGHAATGYGLLLHITEVLSSGTAWIGVLQRWRATGQLTVLHTCRGRVGLGDRQGPLVMCYATEVVSPTSTFCGSNVPARLFESRRSGGRYSLFIFIRAHRELCSRCIWE